MRNVLKNQTCWVDGRGYAGESEDLTPPKLGLKTESFRQGGMDAEIDFDMGMEKLEAKFVLTNFCPFVHGLFGKQVPLTFKAAGKSSDGTVTPYVYQMRGLLKEQDPGTLKAGEAGKLACSMTLTYYKLTIGGKVLHEIDVENMIRIIDGVDQLKEERQALGL